MRRRSNQPDQPSVPLTTSDAPEQEVVGRSSRQRLIGRWLLVGSALIAIVVLVWIGPQVWQLAQDKEALAAWVTDLGWLGPVALVALNAIQIVIAPIPG